jgi:two-component system, NtrC family, C4-dicarboxylate transport response regulator DctD
VPPLAARREDIPILFARLLAEAAARQRVEPPHPGPAVLADLMRRDWAGNVRELRNAAERYALGLGAGDGAARTADPDPTGRLADRVAGFERAEIIRALIAHRGVLRRVHESLGLSRKTLYEKMQKLGIDKTSLAADD